MTYLLVDGENVDSTLGTILNRKPEPEERPRWDRVSGFVKDLWEDEELKSLFFFNIKKNGPVPYKFIHALEVFGYETVLLEGRNSAVVDEGIKKTLNVIGEKEGNIALVTHDHGYCDLLKDAMVNHDRKLAIIGFTEFISADYSKELPVSVHDLERDVNAFIATLSRNKVVQLDSFDPQSLLTSEAKDGKA